MSSTRQSCALASSLRATCRHQPRPMRRIRRGRKRWIWGPARASAPSSRRVSVTRWWGSTSTPTRCGAHVSMSCSTISMRWSRSVRATSSRRLPGGVSTWSSSTRPFSVACPPTGSIRRGALPMSSSGSPAALARCCAPAARPASCSPPMANGGRCSTRSSRSASPFGPQSAETSGTRS